MQTPKIPAVSLHKSCQLSHPFTRPPQLPSVVSHGLPYHEDVRSDSPVRKQQRLPYEDANLSRVGEDENNHQRALYPLQVPGCSLHPGCWQGAPHKPPRRQLLAVRLLRNLWITYRLQARPTALKGTQALVRARTEAWSLQLRGPPPPHFLFQSPCTHPLHSHRRPRCCSWRPQR